MNVPESQNTPESQNIPEPLNTPEHLGTSEQPAPDADALRAILREEVEAALTRRDAGDGTTSSKEQHHQ